MRELADHNVSRYAEVATWPLREALLAMVDRIKRDARDAYARSLDRYMHGRSLKELPPAPSIIAEDVAVND